MNISQDEFIEWRPLLFSIGYRILGSVTYIEDFVHETFLKMYDVEDQLVHNKKAYLCKMMTNRCLDYLKSAQHTKEQYMGPWNPEPILIEKLPADIVLEKEGLSIAYLRMMENLTPNERVVLVLRDVVGFSYSEIADIVDLKENNCRKIYSRAKYKIKEVENESLDYRQNQQIVDQFIGAIQHQNINQLLHLLSEDVTLYSDGGGEVRAALRPIIFNQNVAAFLKGILKNATDDFYYEIKSVNGQPGIISYMDQRLHSVVSFFIIDDIIQGIYITMNPKKLPNDSVQEKK
ncbi:RNA polymerase sigma-70 factor (ECF subfamily) [Aquisalibacillus elongatus]|uniref:RNA polymerase sigma-70 factor (ECF subfamily) n=2 Tax=Aquisalibacillus elongatus TaxID=485577 RepID=A0A3N5C216_9BACI|nr:RNA polymerase sigma-70 factor (ECF subfamily) [Aquisalibacillus elongatus]